jgi:hypothetical protein
MTCSRCRARGSDFFTWDVCADGNRKRRLCPECDIALNRLVLRWAGDKRWREKASAYAKRVMAR